MGTKLENAEDDGTICCDGIVSVLNE